MATTDEAEAALQLADRLSEACQGHNLLIVGLALVDTLARMLAQLEPAEALEALKLHTETVEKMVTVIRDRRAAGR